MKDYDIYLDNGYTQEQAFYMAEIKTTQHILSELGNCEHYNPTLLLNSLLSMIVLPYEKAKKHNNKFFPEEKIRDLEKDVSITPKLFQPISKCDGNNPSYNKQTLKSFVNKLRNGIAHQNIVITISGDREFLITIKNKFTCKHCNGCNNPRCKEKGVKREKGGVIDFILTVSVAQLKKLAFYISNAFIKAIQQEEK